MIGQRVTCEVDGARKAGVISDALDTDLFIVKLDDGIELTGAVFGDSDWWNMQPEEPEYAI